MRRASRTILGLFGLCMVIAGTIGLVVGPPRTNSPIDTNSPGYADYIGWDSNGCMTVGPIALRNLFGITNNFTNRVHICDNPDHKHLRP